MLAPPRRGRRGRVGPDLANLVRRDYASVLRDIRDPDAAIHPDHVAQVVALTDGRVVAGSIREEGGEFLIGDLEGRITEVTRPEIEEMRPSPVSTMPAGLLDALGAERTRDLLTYLLTPALEPAPIRRDGATPPRSAAEVQSVLEALPASDPKSWKPELKVLLEQFLFDSGG